MSRAEWDSTDHGGNRDNNMLCWHYETGKGFRKGFKKGFIGALTGVTECNCWFIIAGDKGSFVVWGCGG